MHVCEESRCNNDYLCKNNVMHVTVVRCEQKLKVLFLQASIHQNDNMFSLKSSRQHSHKEEHKK